MKQLIIFLIIFSHTFIHSSTETLPSEKSFLCLEIGHTRIKEARLPSSLSLEDIKKIQVLTSFSKPYLRN